MNWLRLAQVAAATFGVKVAWLVVWYFCGEVWPQREAHDEHSKFFWFWNKEEK